MKTNQEQQNIPETWEEVTMNDACELMTNGFVGKAVENYTEEPNGVTYVQGYNVTDFGFNFNGIKKVTPEFSTKNSKSILKEKDLLIVQTGEVGLTTIVPPKLVGANCHALIITRLKKQIASPEYFLQYFRSLEGKRQIRRIKTGSTMEHVNVGDLKKVKLHLPPISEQKRIAAVLGAWDHSIKSLKRKIEIKKEIKKGLMQELLTSKTRLPGFNNPWKIYKLTQITSLIKDGTHATHMNVKNGIPLLSAKDIVDGNVITNNDPRLISQTEFEQIHKSYRIQNGDLLLCLVGSIGRVALTKDYKNNYTFQRSVGILRFKNQSPEFFFQLMQASNFQKQLKQRESRGAQGGVYLGELGKINIKIPEFEEQSAIAEILDVADKEIYRLKQKLTILKDQKKYLLNKLVTGAIPTPESLSISK
ncbi:restriction endonuclease subunit S [Nitrosomonas sp.]|uniref:restriction endonuclease subunit S n=1 Tax=Nitrosomonas sp. TaxID=42353 RepID=UPI0025FEE83E|nr:restriction endonuclease subunit S [Nitrosomonas sp.]